MSAKPTHSPLALPFVDGPKIEPFDFKGEQNIEFVKRLGTGCHSEVFQVKINGKNYALKLFGFLRFDSLFIDIYNRPTDRKATNAFAQYIDPFFAECRAFGRLQESGHQDLAIKCHGYVLLDQKHEDMISKRLRKTHDILAYRSFYHEPTEPAPPIRCLVKDLGAPTRLTQKLIWKLFSDVKKLHQLGIFHLDLKMEQLIDGRLADFSIAKTMPHFITNAELNPELPPEWECITQAETWQFCSWDYESLNDTVDEWNCWRDPKRPLRRAQSSNMRQYLRRYSLRAFQVPNFVYANPYMRLWERRVASKKKQYPAAAELNRVRLKREPTKWFQNLQNIEKQDEMMGSRPRIIWWEYRDGRICPIGNGYMFETVDGKLRKVERKPEPEWTAEELEVYARVREQRGIAVEEWRANGGLEEEMRSKQWWRDFANSGK